MAALFKRQRDSKGKKYRINFLFVKRLFRIFRIFFPSCLSAHMALFLLLLLVSVGGEVAVYYVGLIPSEYNTVLPAKDFDGFILTTWQSLLYICLVAVVISAKTYIGRLLYVSWREALSVYIHRSYFKHHNYYKLNVLQIDSIDNPDQRITQDVERLCNQFTSIVPLLLVSPFTIPFYTYSAYAATGFIGPLSIYLYFIFGTIINMFLMAPVVGRTYRQEKLEGSYRFQHVQVRSNAESLAFYSAGDVECDKTNMKLFRLLQTQTNLFNYEFWLEVSINLFNYIGSILSYVVIAIPIFTGVYNHLDSTELYSLISKNSFVCMYLIYCFSQLIDLSNQVTEIAGYSHRIGELLESLSKLSRDNNSSRGRYGITADQTVSDSRCLLTDTKHGWQDGSHGWQEMQESEDESAEGSTCQSSVAYKMHKVSIATPDPLQEILVKELSISIQRGCNLLITGATGSGKTSILRVLRGLLPAHSGTVTMEKYHGPSDVMFVPQKPFLTDGTLREQVIYPARISCLETGNDDILLSAINRVGLQHLYDRIGGLDKEVDWNWSDVLTPGEMQCLSFARLYYAKPSIAFLDEATSAVTVAQEERFYQHCMTLNITLISVGHRASLRDFHERELVLNGDGKWSLESIQQNEETKEE